MLYEVITAEGKPTMPLIHAMTKGTPQQKRLLQEAITERNGMQHLDEILATLHATEAFEYSLQKARDEADMAIACLAPLPDSPYKQALCQLAGMAAQRNA